jgi:hypothetical protein
MPPDFPVKPGEHDMKILQRACGVAVIAFAAMTTGALAEPQSAAPVEMAAAKAQSTGHKTIQPGKSTPRKKSRCFG